MKLALYEAEGVDELSAETLLTRFAMASSPSVALNQPNLRRRRKDRPLSGAKTRAGGTCMSGLSSRRRAAASTADYRRVRKLRLVVRGLQKPSAGVGTHIENGRATEVQANVERFRLRDTYGS